MDDLYKILLIFGASVAVLGSIGIIGVLAGRRDRRRQQVKHQAKASEAAVYGWKYQATGNDAEDFQLTGRSRDGIAWKLAAGPGDGEGGVPATVWSTTAVYAPYVQLCIMKRSDYKHAGTWLGGGKPPLVKQFCESAREIPWAAPGSDDDYVVLAADETVGHQVFGPEAQEAYRAWLCAWQRVKSWGDDFTIQLGGQNLSINANEFLNSMDALQPLIELGEVLARNFLKFRRKEPARAPTVTAELPDAGLQARVQLVKAFHRAHGAEVTEEEAKYLARKRFPIPLGNVILGLFFLLVIIVFVVSLFYR